MLLTSHEVGYMAEKAYTENHGEYAAYLDSEGDLCFEVYDSIATKGGKRDVEDFTFKPHHTHDFGFQKELVWRFPHA